MILVSRQMIGHGRSILTIATALAITLGLGLQAGAAPQPSGAEVRRASGSGSTGHGGTAVPEPRRIFDRAFRSLDASVSAGVVDAPVVRDLRRRGVADAIVSFVDEGSNRLRGLDTTSPRAVRAAVAEMRRLTAVTKDRAALKMGSGAEVVEDYPNLAESHVRFTSMGALLRAANAGEITGVREILTAEAGWANADAASLGLIGQPQAAQAGYRGSGSMVAVLDTGLDHTRATFGSCTAVNQPASCRVVGNWEYAPLDGTLDEGTFHGTNVAGIVANTAPGAELIGMDVFQGKDTYATYMDAALDDLITLKADGWNVVSANMSIYDGTFWTSVCSGSALDSTFTRLRGIGIIPVTIAGNDAEVGGEGTFRNGVAWPGCLPSALTVGAVFDSADPGTSGWCSGTPYADRIACFSQGGPLLDLWAPGLAVEAAGIRQAGTSQAAPHVAGAVAVLAAARPTAGQSDLQAAMTSSGPVIRDARSGTVYSDRRLDLAGSVNTLLGTGDVTKPTVSAPTQVPTLGRSVNADGTVPTTVSWSGSDASGIAAYDLYSSTNGGDWVRVTLPTATTTSIVFRLTAGNTYQFTVAAKDGAGNWSGWKDGAKFKVSNYGDASSAISYSTGWTRYNRTYATGGTTTASNTAGATATFTFTGRAFAWVATTHANAGKMNLSLDDVPQGTWNLYSTTTVARKMMATWKGAWGTHTVKLTVEGTGSVDVDSFIALE